MFRFDLGEKSTGFDAEFTTATLALGPSAANPNIITINNNHSAHIQIVNINNSDRISAKGKKALPDLVDDEVLFPEEVTDSDSKIKFKLNHRALELKLELGDEESDRLIEE